MAIRHYKKISELDAITSASLSTYVAGVDNGQTVRITLDVLADGVRNTINTIDIQRLNALEAATSSYLTSLNGAISGSSQLTSSYDERYVISGSLTQTTWDNISGKPNGLISQSTDLSHLNSFTSSQNTLNTAFTNAISARLQTTTYNTDSASFDARIIAATNEQSFNGLISGSEQLTSSYDERYTLSGSVVVSPNTISSSTQITDLGFVSGSYETTGRGILSGSISYTSLTNIPIGIISESVDISLLNSFTQSYFTDSSSFDARIIAATNEQDLSQLNNFTASQSTLNTAFTNGINARLQTSSFNTFTSSYYLDSSSFDSRLDYLEAYSSSLLVPSSSMSFRTLQTDLYVKNITGTQINKGTVVRIIGNTGDNPLISIASYDTEGLSANTLGITTEDIPNDDWGYVITEGILLGVNTNGLTAGQLLYLGSNGTFTTTQPVAPLHSVRLGQVLRPQLNAGSIHVRIDNGAELGELHNIIDLSTNSSIGDILMKSGSVWINNSTFSASVDSRLDNQEAFSSSLSVLANSSTKILDAVYTSAAAWSGSYTGHGGIVKVEANFTIFSTTTGTKTFQLYRDGVIVDSGSFYFNQSAVHTVMPTLYYIGANETGTHTYSVGHNATSDVNDSCNIVVTETFNSLNGGLATTGSNTFRGTNRFETVGADEGGEIEFGVPQTNTTLQNRVTTDIWQNRYRIFEGSVNAKGVHIDLSKAPTGASGEIMWKASGMVNAGVSVTLDDIQARFTTSGGRSLEIRTTGASFTAMASAHTTYNNGSYTYYSDKSFTMSTTFGYPGNQSWGFTGDGDLAVYWVRDTTNLRFWRFTLMVGPGYNNNLILIERLH
jgi:hypothetical protein